MMTKVLSALIMVSMVGTSVQVPTLAEVANAGRAIVAGTVEDKAKDASGSTESKDAGAADDEDNKNQDDAENAENNEQAAASDSNAQNNTENSSKGGANTSSVSGAKNNSSSSSSYNNISSSNTSNKSTSTSQILEPFSKDNDSDKLSFDKDFSLFSYFGQTQTFSAIAANGDGSDIEWQVEPKFFSISTPKVDGSKSTVDITWDKETVEDIERTPFYAMLKSNPYEKITGTIYLSNGQAPSEEEQQQDAGSKKEFESEEVKNFVEDMYKTGLTQENSVYDLSLLGDTNNNTGATDFSNMSDEEILKAFEEKQNSENADNKDNTETLSDTKTETTENTTDKTDKVADLDKDAKVDADKSEETASDNALYNRKENQSKVSENESKADSNTDSKAETKQDTSVIDNNEKSAANDNTKTDVKAETKAIAKPETTKTETSDNEKLSEVTSKELTETTTQVLSNATNNTTNSETKTSDEVGEDDFVTVQSEETAEPETKTVTETVEVPTTKTVEQEVQKEVSKTKQVATTTTKTTTTEIVSQEPIVETKTKTVYEEVPAEKEVTVEKQVAVGEDEETGETQYETVSETTTVQSTETVAKEETVEEQVGTNYTVRETVTTDTTTSVDGVEKNTDSSTSVNEYTTTSEPSVGTTTDSFTTYSEEEIKEYVAEKVNIEVSAVETQTVEKEVTAETNSQSTVSSSKGHGSSSIKKGNSNTTNSTVNNSKTTSVSNSSNATSSDKTEVTETVNSENVATDNSAAETASNDNANISLESETGFEQRFQRIAVGESFNAATVFGSGVSNVKVINSNIASASGTTITAKAFGRTQVVGTVNGEMSIIELEVRTSSSDVAAPMVAAGGRHTVALKKDGTVWTWGYNANCELGDGTTDTKYYPVQVQTGEQKSNTGYLENIIQVAAGSNHNLALAKDGTVWAWGYGPHGELGNGKTYNSSLPVKVIGVSDVVSIAAGYYNSFAVRKDGTVWAWGYNNAGQLGLGDGANRTTAQQVLGGASGSQYLTDIVEVKAATWHTLALKANGTVYAWGNNSHSQLGSTGSSSSRPVQVVTGQQGSASGYLEKVVELDAASEADSTWGTSIAVTESKEVYGWGYSNYGALGKTGEFKSPIKVSNINTAVGAALGGTDSGQFTYILKEDGTVSSLGYNGYGQLGNGTTSSSSAAQDVQNLKDVVQVVGAQNGYFGAAVRTDGTVWAWGLNTSGQLGNSKNENSSIPVSVGYPPTTNFDVQYAEVQKSETGTTVRKYEDSSMPRSLSGGEAIAEDEQIVIDTSKLIGEQIFGFNLITDKSSSYSNAKDIEISSFDETLFTIKNGNTIVPNQNGKYGTGVVIIRDTDPTRNFVGIIRVQVKPKDAVATPMVSAKQSSTVALKADGTVWTWGYNVAGQLGNNSTADSLIPVQVLGGATGNQYLTNVVQVAAGGTFDGGNRYYALALRENGTVWAWGDNSYGQLGIGVKGNPTDSSKTSCLTPMQVVTGEQDSSSTYLEDIIQISAGPTFAMALDRKGNVYTWGLNNVGQLGNNTTTGSNAPVRVSGGLAYTVYLGDVVQIAAGGDWVNGTNDFAVVLRKDGSVMTWGQNSNGQLGNKSYTSSLTPVRPVGIDGDTDKGLQNVVQITAGGVSAGVVTTDRKAYTWGYNAQRQLGVDTSASTVNVPTVVKTDASTELSDVVEIAAGMQQMSARVIEDASADPFTKVYAWGNNSYGQLGLNKSDATYVYATRVVGGETKKDYLEDTVSLYAGGYHMGSVQSDYSVWDWGYNINGQLGDGTTDRRKVPVKVVSDMGQPQLTISTATWTNNGVDNDVVIYYDTLKMQNTSKIVTSIQEGDILSIDLSGISGVSSFNLLRASAYTPDDLTFKSVDTEVATVDAKTGVVTAKKTGITYIVVTDKNGAEGFFKLNVEPQGTNYIAYPQVQPGFYHTVALKADGTVWAWGYNAHGELGIGTAGGDHDHPEQVLRKENQSDPDSNNVPLTNIVKIAVGAYHNLALTADGQVYAWGWGIYGSLGDGDTSDHSSTVAMRVVGTGYSNNNTNTYLGDGNGSDFIVDIGAGGYSNYASYSMALDIKGTLYTWGRNYKSVIDPKNTSDSYVTGVPVNITKNNSMLNGAVRINSDAIGHIGSVLRSDGQIVSWGYNGYGSAGNGTTSDRITTTQADLNGKKALYAKHGWHNAVAITTDGLVMMWGYAGYGTTGLGNSTTNTKPTVVADYSKHNYEQAIETMSADSIEMQADDSDDTSLKKVSVNLVMKNGEASTALGVLSDEAPTDADALYEVELPLGSVSATPVVFATSKNATVQFYNVEMTALDGTVFTEGDDTSYAGASLNTYNVATSGNDKFEQLVKVHVESASGIGADYLIKLINYPSTTITASPVFADASLSSVVLMTDGRLYTSGQAGIYATGQGPNSKFGVVGNVLAGDSGEEGTYLEDIINAAVTADERPGQSMYAIKSNGSVWAWGNNSYYKLGNGSNKDESTPVRVGASYLTMSQYLYSLKVNGGSVTIPAPSVDSFNVFNSNNGGKTDAKLLWQTYDGNNNIITVNPDTGEITPVGVGTTYVIVSIANDPLTTGLVKVEVRPSDLTVGKTSVAYPQVAAGTDFTVALKADGTVWTWGQNTYGQLGNGVSNGTVVYPEKIDSLSDIIKIAAAGQTAVALKTDGTVWTWGRNDNGQLGNGTTVSSNVPVQVLKGEQNQGNADKTYLENIVAIAAGGLNDEKIFVVALDSNGNVYGFGSNEYRQLKIANDASYNTPVVSPAVNAVDVAAGRGATVYTLTSNGLVYALGKNYAYEYGTGGTSGSVYTLVPLDNRAMAIGAGNQNGIAVTYSLDASSKPSTKTYAWGNNAYYAISPNNTSTLRTPTEMLGRDNTAIIGGGDSIYTIDKDSQLKISGLGDHGQLANGSEDNSTSMVPYSEFAKNDGTTATDAIGASSSRNGAHSLYIDSNGSVWSVGDNTSSQLALQNAGDKINVAQMIGAEPTILVKEREILAKIDKQQNIGNIIDIKGSFNLFSSADAAATYSQEFDVWD